MKSKAEILDIIYHCINRGQCPDCPLFSDEDCTIHIFSALNTLLNKSDFEVVEEVLTRSKKHDWLGTGFSGDGYTIELLDVFDAPTIDFDGEGNIL